MTRRSRPRSASRSGCPSSPLGGEVPTGGHRPGYHRRARTSSGRSRDDACQRKTRTSWRPQPPAPGSEVPPAPAPEPVVESGSPIAPGADGRGRERPRPDRPRAPLGGRARDQGPSGVRSRARTARHGAARGPGVRERSPTRRRSPGGRSRVPDLPVADPARAVPRERVRPGDRALGGRPRRPREEDRHDRGARGRDLAGRRRLGERSVVAPDPRRVPHGLGGAGRLPGGSVDQRVGVGDARPPRELAEGLTRGHRFRPARGRDAGVPAEAERGARCPRR